LLQHTFSLPGSRSEIFKAPGALAFSLEEHTMREHLLVLCALATFVFTPASAQTGQFWIDWDNAAKKCIVVTQKPTDKNVEGGGPFRTRADAEAALKTVKGCS
jgi:hypothetical protein